MRVLSITWAIGVPAVALAEVLSRDEYRDVIGLVATIITGVSVAFTWVCSVMVVMDKKDTDDADSSEVD